MLKWIAAGWVAFMWLLIVTWFFSFWRITGDGGPKIQPQERNERTMNFARLKIVSGGQTGADRVGSDWAVKHGISHGGWCPKGRRSETPCPGITAPVSAAN